MKDKRQIILDIPVELYWKLINEKINIQEICGRALKQAVEPKDQKNKTYLKSDN